MAIKRFHRDSCTSYGNKMAARPQVGRKARPEGPALPSPYLKCGPRVSAGAKGLSVTMVVPVPTAWTGIT